MSSSINCKSAHTEQALALNPCLQAAGFKTYTLSVETQARVYTCSCGLPMPCMMTTVLTCSQILRASPCVQSQLPQLMWQLQGHLGVQRACRWVPEAPPGCGQRSRCAGGTLCHHCTVVCGICMPKLTVRWCHMTEPKGSKDLSEVVSHDKTEGQQTVKAK